MRTRRLGSAQSLPPSRPCRNALIWDKPRSKLSWLRITMHSSIEQILASYNDRAPLSQASTIPAPWYTDPRIAELERLNVFSKTWQLVARTSQLQNAGDFVTTRLAGEPIVVVRGAD